MAGLSAAWDAFWGRGEASVTVPSMDGSFRPNTRLDDASRLIAAPGIDNAVAHGGRLLVSQGRSVLAFDRTGGRLEHVAEYAAPVSALASDGSRLAVALDDGAVTLDGQAVALNMGKGSATALAFRPDGTLLVGVGSQSHPASRWCLDLMSRGKDGAVWEVARDGSARLLASGLAHVGGLCAMPDGAVLVSESWQHRLVAVQGKERRVLLSDLPAYPGRVLPAAGGYYLCLFAPRSQMVEFVLREPEFRRRMVTRLPEAQWMAPCLRVTGQHQEPVQGGGIRHLGIHKPWAPSRSYGLVARLDAAAQAVESWHSRSDGQSHGVTSVALMGGRPVVTAKGDGVLLELDQAEVRA